MQLDLGSQVGAFGFSCKRGEGMPSFVCPESGNAADLSCLGPSRILSVYHDI